MNDLNKKNIDDALKEHFASKCLSERQLEELFSLHSESENTMISGQALLSDSANNKINKDRGLLKRLFPDTGNYRPAFFVTVFLLFACLYTVYILLDKEPLSQQIMSEIVYNHNQDMPIEIESSSLTDIGEYLNKLNFSIILPKVLTDSQWRILGARYCSINGKLAAQLKVKNLKDNSVATLYQALINKNIKKSDLLELSDSIDGVGVSIWREQGLLLGLAKENK